MIACDPDENPDLDPHGVIGATFCMMSCSMQSGSPLHLRRIVNNLAWLAAHPKVGNDLRLCCGRLHDHWERIVDALHDLEVRQRADPTASPPRAPDKEALTHPRDPYAMLH
jgi:hypothetical protein